MEFYCLFGYILRVEFSSRRIADSGEQPVGTGARRTGRILMTSQLRRTLSKALFYLLLLPMLLVNLRAHGQTSSVSLEPGAPGSDALPFLTELLARYTHASSYHLEYIEEHQFDSEFSRNWSKAFISSIVGPANHYRFERRGDFGTAAQVSDGQTEWIYYSPLNQYVQQPAPRVDPSEVTSRAAIGLSRLRQAQAHMKNFAYLRSMVRTATFVPEQTIEVAGKSMSCIVITTEGAMPNAQSPIAIHLTFWIDKHSKLIRKSTQRSEGEMTAEPGAHYSGLARKIHDFRSTKGLAMVQIRCLRGFDTKSEAFA